MPDFFDRLVARAGLREPAGVARVRPRLPSLFERPQSPAEPTPYQKTPRPRPTASAANPPGARSGPPGERRAEPALVQLVRQPVVYRNEQRVVAAPGPTPVPPGPVRPPAVLRPTGPPAGPPRPAPRITPPAAAPEPRARPKTAPPQPGPLPRGPVAVSAVRRAPAREPAREPAPARRRQQPPRPERVVHVSIGRLEVRAAAPGPAPRPRPGRPAPVMPLDEFLAREEG
ncbi:hypothetical protein [Carbonactinospora thermoautotrophica]|uniref:hypothetical protein n=1 Tax=Carbonactinospora thermoautotrophica TaxID=1469144 RepID=UPI003DA93465